MKCALQYISVSNYFYSHRFLLFEPMCKKPLYFVSPKLYKSYCSLISFLLIQFLACMSTLSKPPFHFQSIVLKLTLTDLGTSYLLPAPWVLSLGSQTLANLDHDLTFSQQLNCQQLFISRPNDLLQGSDIIKYMLLRNTKLDINSN